ncbi:hypothetical protein ES705_40183 [subsurface metagenome]
MNIGRSVKKLVVKECACYDPSTKGIIHIKNIPQSITIKNYCDREHDKDCRCLVFKYRRCDYFERVVLPMNPQLEALYKAEHIAEEVGYKMTKGDKKNILEKESSIKGKVKIHCKKCGKTFLANNYRQQYCDYCKRSIRREQKRKSSREARCGQSAL